MLIKKNNRYFFIFSNFRAESPIYFSPTATPWVKKFVSILRPERAIYLFMLGFQPADLFFVF